MCRVRRRGTGECLHSGKEMGTCQKTVQSIERLLAEHRASGAPRAVQWCADEAGGAMGPSPNNILNGVTCVCFVAACRHWSFRTAAG